MKDILVVAMLREGQFPKFMSFMQSDEGIAERKKIADLSKTIGTVAPDQRHLQATCIPIRARKSPKRFRILKSTEGGEGPQKITQSPRALPQGGQHDPAGFIRCG